MSDKGERNLIVSVAFPSSKNRPVGSAMHSPLVSEEYPMLIEQFAPELENIISLSEPIQMLADDALERRYGGRMAARDCGRAGSVR